MTDWKRLKLPLASLGLSAVVFAGLSLSSEASWFAASAGFALTAVFIFKAAFPASYDMPPAAADADEAKLDENVIEKFIEALPDPCLLLDGRGIVVAFNDKALAHMPGLSKNEPLSFNLRSPLLHDALIQALAGHSSHIEIEDKVPIERWTSFFLNPLSLSGKRADHVCITLHDRTEQVRAETMRADFVANASHELRTPLASLLGFVETLQGPARDDEKSRVHFLAIMQAQAKRMSRLIDDLLSLSRIEKHAHIQPDTRLEIVSLLQSTLDGLKPLAAERGVEMLLQKSGENFIVRGDRDELYRTFENLIENAIKYGESGKKVEIGIKKHNDMINISVRDYGPGIAEAHLPRLTERFYRVDEVASREKGGTGLGLAIVKHILNRHRGELEIESTPGQGSVFTAFLPPAA